MRPRKPTAAIIQAQGVVRAILDGMTPEERRGERAMHLRRAWDALVLAESAR